MRILGSRGAAALIGAASWTATEYGLHRFLMHELRGRGLASVEHLKHHADVTYFSPAPKKLASAAATTAVAYPATATLAGRRWATAFTAGLLSMYFAYEVAHRRTHTHPPRNPYGRWARRELDELTMLIGPDEAARLLEIGVARGEGIDFIVHAMPARPKFLE